MQDQPNRPFIQGLDLARLFFAEQVKPILDDRFPTLRYSAALIGSGSEVLGFDTEMSSDHHWGPRVMLFLKEDVFKEQRDAIDAVLSRELRAECHGYPTHWSDPDPLDGGVQHLVPVESGAIQHRVETYTVADFFKSYMNIDVDRELSPQDWLTLPFQKLRSIVSGEIFHDDLGLGAVRKRFRWYPHDVWLYLLASGWTRIGQEEHLMGRAGYVGDEVGSALIASRLVRDIMKLAFLMEKVYPPYPKWFGTAFGELESAQRLLPHLTGVLHAKNWPEREKHLIPAYELSADMHNGLGITAGLDPKVSPFWGRPFQVIHGDRFAQAIVSKIAGEEIRDMAGRRLIGNIDLISDNTDLLEDCGIRQALTRLY